MVLISSVALPIVSYCLASILMTLVNKVGDDDSIITILNDPENCLQFVVSGKDFSMNFLLLTIQSTVCVLCVLSVKKAGVISFREFDMQDAKKWFPISFLLVSVIYTGSKSIERMSYNLLAVERSLIFSLAIPQHPSLHNIQEPDYNLDCE